MGSKAREGVKAMSLVFVLLDFQHARVRRRVCVVYKTECRHAAGALQQSFEFSGQVG